MTSADDRYWQAVIERDTAFDDRFVFAVRSTGIYCRPTCPARRPARTRVAFYEQPALAAAAGFRPCRRCRPDEPRLAEQQAELVQRACRLIETQVEQPFALEALADSLTVRPVALQRAFRQVLGLTPRQYAASARLTALKARLKEGQTVTAALYDAGYSSSSRLYEHATDALGMTPATYGRGGAGATIRYAILPCPLGQLLVAATERGLCSITFGEDKATLVAALVAEFPTATIQADAERLGDWTALLSAHLEGQQPALSLPLDVQATAFQRRVWQALQAIPYGATRSYQAVAAAIGQPSAARAVARACATNPVALAIPCHRVVRGDGAAGGYRWGEARKAALLAREQATSRATSGSPLDALPPTSATMPLTVPV